MKTAPPERNGRRSNGKAAMKYDRKPAIGHHCRKKQHAECDKLSCICSCHALDYMSADISTPNGSVQIRQERRADQSKNWTSLSRRGF